jgi:hypothetical protein
MRHRHSGLHQSIRPSRRTTHPTAAASVISYGVSPAHSSGPEPECDLRESISGDTHSSDGSRNQLHGNGDRQRRQRDRGPEHRGERSDRPDESWQPRRVWPIFPATRTYTVGVAIPENVPTSTGGAPLAYSEWGRSCDSGLQLPPLPAGLRIEHLRGSLSATLPRASSAEYPRRHLPATLIR